MFLLYYSLAIIAVSGGIAATALCTYAISRNPVYVWFSAAFALYTVDVALVVRPSFDGAPPPPPGHITGPLESAGYAAGILFCLTTVTLTYTRISMVWRTVYTLAYVALSAVAYFAVSEPHLRQFLFFSARNVFILGLLALLAVMHARAQDPFHRTKLGRIRMLGFLIGVGVLAIVVENVVFQLLLPLAGMPIHQVPFLAERSFSENLVMMGLGAYVVAHCRRIFLLHQDKPRAVAEEPTRRFADELFADFAAHHKLSKRERDVFEALVYGKTNTEIAESLGIAVGTVKVHVHNIAKKTGRVGREEIVRSFFAEI